MKEMKIHLCETCGGKLIVDLEKQMYRCQYCGVTYDYAYFREDDVLSKGDSYLRNREFKAAIEAYRFYLTKDPHDFSTIRSLMLALNGIRDTNELRKHDLFEDFVYNAAETDPLIDFAEEGDKEYFSQIAKIFRDRDTLVKKKNGLLELEAALQKVETDIMKMEREMGKNFTGQLKNSNKDDAPEKTATGTIFSIIKESARVFITVLILFLICVIGTYNKITYQPYYSIERKTNDLKGVLLIELIVFIIIFILALYFDVCTRYDFFKRYKGNYREACKVRDDLRKKTGDLEDEIEKLHLSIGQQFSALQRTEQKRNLTRK